MIREILEAFRLFSQRLDVWRRTRRPLEPNLRDPAVVGDCDAVCPQAATYVEPFWDDPLRILCTRVEAHAGYHVAFGLDHLVCVWGRGLHLHQRLEIDVVQSLADGLEEALPGIARVSEALIRRFAE